LANSVQLISHRADFQRALHDWYRVNHRKLPWREAPSLYKTVVSEFMLQQTQVATVLPYFERWLRELPDFAALAAAAETRVIKLWEGLGYYSRARNLHKLGQAVAALPHLPRSVAEWQELPGIGPYTAAAIASISLGQPAACVDGNVVRILARLTADGFAFVGPNEGEMAERGEAGIACQVVPLVGVDALPLGHGMPCERCLADSVLAAPGSMVSTALSGSCDNPAELDRQIG